MWHCENYLCPRMKREYVEEFMQIKVVEQARKKDYAGPW
jgi:hypothetical protein